MDVLSLPVVTATNKCYGVAYTSEIQHGSET